MNKENHVLQEAAGELRNIVNLYLEDVYIEIEKCWKGENAKTYLRKQKKCMDEINICVKRLEVLCEDMGRTKEVN